MIQLSGCITHIVYRGKGDWAIVKFRSDSGSESTATGELQFFGEGEPLVLHGEWVEKPYKGKLENQFKASAAYRREPVTLPQLELFLSNAVAGCGPTRAKLMIHKFKEELFSILKDGKAEKLLEVVGIGGKTATRILHSFQEKSAGMYLCAFLISIGLGPDPNNKKDKDKTEKVLKALGLNAIQKIRRNPYCLTRVYGIGFVKADKVAQKMGWTPDSPERAEATLFFVLSEAATQGHSYLPKDLLIQLAVTAMKGKDKDKEVAEASEAAETPATAPQELSVADLTAILEKALGVCYEKKSLIKEVANMNEPVEMTYTPNLYRAESLLARKIRILLSTKPVCRYTTAQLGYFIQESEKALSLTLTAEQRLAIIRAFTEPISILTGGPGTGKTQTMRALVDVARRLGYKPSLCAPTGRAAKHLSGVTDAKALTIHRLLKYDPEENAWNANAESPLETDMVISDEVSMVDIELAYRVADAIQPGTPWLIIGDKDQLPAVSPGRVLEDLIISKKIIVTRLTKVFRQAAESRIIQNAHRILKGEALEFPDKGCVALSDCYLIEPREIPALDEKGRQKITNKGPQVIEDYEWMKAAILMMCKKNIPDRFPTFNPIRDVQVLTPMREKGLSVQMLNETLQEALNPLKAGMEEAAVGARRFRVGDRVQQYRNNYQLGEDHEGVYNGDIGFITAIDNTDEILTIDFGGDKDVKYPYEDAKDDLHLGFCMSIHKSQGGEFPVVIVVLTRANWMMLQRNLLYTATTRAKQLLVFICGKDRLKEAIKRVEIQNRYSFLHIRLRREMEASKAAA